MMSIIGQHFKSVRQQQGLTVTDLARRCGFHNLNKGRRRIELFEMTGCVHPNLLSKLAHELGVSNATIHDLMMEDRRRFIQRWSEWASERIEPYVIIKLMPAVYHRIRFPQTTTTLEDAEVFASAQALRFTRACCLVWTRRLSVWFDASGIVYSRTEAVPDEPNIPTMRLRSSRRNLLMDNAGFRLIEAPPTPPLKSSEDGLIFSVRSG